MKKKTRALQRLLVRFSAVVVLCEFKALPLLLQEVCFSGGFGRESPPLEPLLVSQAAFTEFRENVLGRFLPPDGKVDKRFSIMLELPIELKIGMHC